MWILPGCGSACFVNPQRTTAGGHGLMNDALFVAATLQEDRRTATLGLCNNPCYPAPDKENRAREDRDGTPAEASFSLCCDRHSRVCDGRPGPRKGPEH